MRVEDYSWIEGDTGPIEAICIAVMASASEAQVLEALGANVESLHRATFREAEAAWSDEGALVQVWAAEGRTIVVEPNGYLASIPETLVRMAAGGDAASVFWNVNALTSVVVVRNGGVVRVFDPLMYDDDEERLPEEEGLPFGGDENTTAAALAFLERVTGFRASEAEILSVSRPAYRIADPR